MRSSALPLLATAGLLALTSPAAAAWQGYISHTLGFAFAAPGELKMEKATYKGAVAGTRDETIYSTVADDVEYRAIVIDTRDHIVGSRLPAADAAQPAAYVQDLP